MGTKIGSMKKLLIITCCVFVFVVANSIWKDQSRDYYCFSDGKCFTVWRHGSGCYLIPGKYHGIFAPKDDYILKTDFSKELGVVKDKKRRDKIIVEGDSSCCFVQKRPGVIVFYNDESGNKEFDSLYTHDNGHYNNDLEYYNVDIQEMYARTNVKGYKAPTGITYYTLLSMVIYFGSILLLFVLIVILIFKLISKLRKK